MFQICYRRSILVYHFNVENEKLEHMSLMRMNTIDLNCKEFANIFTFERKLTVYILRNNLATCKYYFEHKRNNFIIISFNYIHYI